jgi:hypothetical protein
VSGCTIRYFPPAAGDSFRVYMFREGEPGRGRRRRFHALPPVWFYFDFDFGRESLMGYRVRGRGKGGKNDSTARG